jgi:hypothetical protein
VLPPGSARPAVIVSEVRVEVIRTRKKFIVAWLLSAGNDRLVAPELPPAGDLINRMEGRR